MEAEVLVLELPCHEPTRRRSASLLSLHSLRLLCQMNRPRSDDRSPTSEVAEENCRLRLIRADLQDVSRDPMEVLLSVKLDEQACVDRGKSPGNGVEGEKIGAERDV